ncbi:hypothetical protein AB0L65_33245 [Nonomuraea sp. NPDC052116]|uniref:hypothetical protein n=1 Tax=Nonomuraea sp. NPDC052116 TaxID=3155665 RepID=UPI00343F5ED3
MSTHTSTYRTEAHQIVTWTYDSGTSQTNRVSLDTIGTWACGGCGTRGTAKPYQAQLHATQCRKTNAEGDR